MEKLTTLTESTLIPIGAVVLVFGFAMWMTKIFYQGEANAQDISSIKAQTIHDIDKIDKKLERIEDKVDRLLSNPKLR